MRNKVYYTKLIFVFLPVNITMVAKTLNMMNIYH